MIDEKKLMKEVRYLKSVIRHNPAIDEIIKLIKQQEVVGEWIPVSERLPNEEEFKKDDGRFMLDDGNRRYQGLFDIYDGCFKFSKHISGLNYELFEDKCVIAWQPLPESYKEDKEMGGDSDGQKDFKAISSVEARAREAGEKD